MLSGDRSAGSDGEGSGDGMTWTGAGLGEKIGAGLVIGVLGVGSVGVGLGSAVGCGDRDRIAEIATKIAMPANPIANQGRQLNGLEPATATGSLTGAAGLDDRYPGLMAIVATWLVTLSNDGWVAAASGNSRSQSSTLAGRSRGSTAIPDRTAWLTAAVKSGRKSRGLGNGWRSRKMEATGT